MRYRLALLLLPLPLWLLPGTASAEDAEIAYLLNLLRSSDCIFVRNGEDHSGAEAADHLAMKYRNGRRWVDDAEEFIDRIASGSSISRRPYLVRCPAAPEETSRAWLTTALEQHRAADPAD